MQTDKTRVGNKGFTLLELLVVLTLLGILALAAVPRFNAAADYIELRKDAGEIARQLRLARHRAIATMQANQVRFYPDLQRYRVYQPVQKTYSLSSGVRFVYVSFPKDARGWIICQFSPLGVPTAGGTAALENRRGQRLYVVVNPVTGRVRISPTPPAE